MSALQVKTGLLDELQLLMVIAGTLMYEEPKLFFLTVKTRRCFTATAFELCFRVCH
jgi:hypothetical protein